MVPSLIDLLYTIKALIATIGFMIGLYILARYREMFLGASTWVQVVILLFSIITFWSLLCVLIL